jgi:hypothetical protein
VRDVRMVERRERPGLAFEARQAIGVAGERFRQDLESDVAAELAVMSAIDLTHPAFAELAENSYEPTVFPITGGKSTLAVGSRRVTTGDGAVTTGDDG